MGRRFQLACLGRIAVDLYGQQHMTSLEDSSSFRRYLGGSSGNVAVGASRLGLRVAMISAVGKDPMGRYLLQKLDQEGVNRDAVAERPDNKTALVFLGMLGAEAVGLDFYRHAAADDTVAPDVLPAGFLSQVDVLSVTGTHFVRANSGAAEIVAEARTAGCRLVLDIDYRPTLWAKAEGGIPAAVSRVRALAETADLVVGNVEEVEVFSGATGVLPALRAARARTAADLVIKLGPEGAACVSGPVPDRIEALEVVPGPTVDVVNPVGAGDAFLSAVLSGWITGEPMAECLSRGTHSGALVVTRHACSDAMPYPDELAAFRAGAAADDDWLAHIHRAQSRRARPSRILALACDHRDPFRALLNEHGRGHTEGAAFKALVAQAADRVVARHCLGAGAMLMDPQFGTAVLEDRTTKGWWLGRPVEVTGSRPLETEAGADLGPDMATWNPGHVAKVLVWHHPDDDDALREAQCQTLMSLQAACRAAGVEWMLEVVPPLDKGHDDEVLRRGVAQMYDAGLLPDYLKLPVLETQAGWDALAALITERDPFCRGVVVLGLNQPFDALERGLRLAAEQDICAGFAVGRTIFGPAAQDWFAGRMSDDDAVSDMADRFARIVEIFTATESAAREAKSA